MKQKPNEGVTRFLSVSGTPQLSETRFSEFFFNTWASLSYIKASSEGSEPLETSFPAGLMVIKQVMLAEIVVAVCG